MESQFFVEEEAVKRSTVPPMFVALSDEHERPVAVSAAYNADDGDGDKPDWVVERMMDSYN